MISNSSNDLKSSRPDDPINKRTGVSAVPDIPYLTTKPTSAKPPNIYMSILIPHLLYQVHPYTSPTHKATYNLALTFPCSKRRRCCSVVSAHPPIHPTQHPTLPSFTFCEEIAWRADCQIDTLPYMHTGLAPSMFPASPRLQLPSYSELPFPLFTMLLTVRFMHVMYRCLQHCMVHITNPLLTAASVR